MAKITLENVLNILGNPTSAQNTINNNSDAIEAAFENTLSRDGTTPNQMLSDLDMNDYDLLNVNTIGAKDISIEGTSMRDLVDEAKDYRDDAASSAVSAQNYASSASSYAIAAATSASDAQSAADTLSLMYAAFSGGSSGQILSKSSDANYDFSWKTVSGLGDMQSSVYDPNSVGADAFDLANMTGSLPSTSVSGLGDSATRNVGETNTTVAAGDIMTSGTSDNTFDDTDQINYVTSTTRKLGTLSGLISSIFKTTRKIVNANFDTSFRLWDTTDNSKGLSFDLTSISTGQTRKIIMPDSDITLGGSAAPTVKVFNTSGTWTKPAGLKAVKVTVVGGCGASFNASGTGLAAGASSFGSHCSASGGNGGNSSGAGSGGAGGTGTGGDINVTGQPGDTSTTSSATHGGMSAFGLGRAANVSSTSGVSGGGGGGSMKYIIAANLGATETVTVGAAGTGGNTGSSNGIVIVEEFY